jgi:hypothetical protein
MAMAQHEPGGADDQWSIQRLEELDVPMGLKVLPEGPDYRCGFILLEGELAFALERPWVPATTL